MICKIQFTTLVINFLLLFSSMLIGALIIISNYYGTKCLKNLLQLEKRNDMLKVIGDIMAHCYDM